MSHARWFVGMVVALCATGCGSGTGPANPPAGPTSPPASTLTPAPSATAPAATSPTIATASSLPVAQTPTPAAPPSFADDLAFLRKHAEPLVLESPAGGRVVVSPQYQGRVMTSAVSPDGASLGWIHRRFIEAGKTGTAFDNYGGEDRFWLGPEGGQFGLYFAPGAPFRFDAWQTPNAFQLGTWEAKERSNRHVVFARSLTLQNHSATQFAMDVRREISLLDAAQVQAKLGVAVPASVQWVAYQSDNRITNTGTAAWSEKTGLPSIWILAMYPPTEDTLVVVPFERKATGPIVNDAYFGKVPADRLQVREADGVLVFRCDGKHRSKIGLGPSRALSVAGSYAPSAKLLTIVQYDKPKGPGRYVNSMWELQKDPFAGDVVNSYNDGPTEPGKPALGGFYELETSSPGAALRPKQSLGHVHRTFHFVGEPALLDPIAKKVLGVEVSKLKPTP